MTKVKPNKEFEIEFAKVVDADGNKTDMKYNFILSFKKPIHLLQGKVEGMQKFFMEDIGGIDTVKLAGNYAVEIVIARTFDPDEVIDAIKAGLPTLQSDLVTTKLVTD